MTQQATYLRTDTVPLGKLTPYPGNAKKGDLDAILASLRRSGQYRSLVVREAGKRLIVLAGNHTMAALAAHGSGPCGVSVTVDGREQPCGVCGGKDWTPAARCEVISCDDDSARRINLADNKTADLGSYDDKALLELLTSMDGDFDGSGYAEDDLDQLLKVTGALAEETTKFLAPFTSADTPPPAPEPASSPASSAGAEQGQAAATAAAPPAPVAEPPAAPAGAPAGSGEPAVPPAVFSAAPAAAPAGMPAPHTTVPIQWVVTLDQRDTIRAAIKHAQTTGGFDIAAEALTHICHTYLTAQGVSQ